MSQSTGPEEREFVEPIAIEETLPNPAGDWDVRFSCQHLHATDEQLVTCPRTQFFLGLPRRLGAEINVPFTLSTSASTTYGLGNLSGAMKYLLRAPSQSRPAIALSLEAGFPTAGSGEDNAFEIQPSVAFLKQLGRATLQGNWGYSFAVREESAGQGSQFQGGASLAFPLHRWYLLAEVDGAGSELMVAPGVKYRIPRGGFLALGVPLGVTAASPDFGLIFQIQFSIRKSAEARERANNDD
jgi:hypothetical protein